MTDTRLGIDPPDMARLARRAALASAVGTTIEYYDFFAYGTAAALVFGPFFFPRASATAGLLAVFAVFAAGFAVRPLGGLVFGHLADRAGRKSILVATLSTMGLGTFGMGLLPSYAVAGIWAPILLVTLRLVQGFALGGEWGSATVFVSEYAPQGKRGLFGAVVQEGSPAGLLLGSGLFALMELLPKAQFDAWGWRVPFLLSLLIVAVGLYIRLNVLESPEYLRAVEHLGKPRNPVVTAMRRQPRNLLATVGVRFAPDIMFYVAATFMVSYGHAQLHVPSGTLLAGVVIAGVIELATVPLFGRLSDRAGRRPVYIGGAITCAVLAFPLFALTATRITLLVWLALALAFTVAHASQWSVGAALYSELFDTEYRCSGTSLSYNVALSVGGGPAPFIATALVAAAGSWWPVSLYLIGAAAVTLVSVYAVRETRHRDLSRPLSSLGTPALLRPGARPERLHHTRGGE
ncbi:MAG TPA: MFS transporter [Streptosporangiaceae bacterium]|nr:MFS transporter [Streptosporangiaceae bacterium]